MIDVINRLILHMLFRRLATSVQQAKEHWDKEQRRGRGKNQSADDRAAQGSILLSAFS